MQLSKNGSQSQKPKIHLALIISQWFVMVFERNVGALFGNLKTSNYGINMH